MIISHPLQPYPLHQIPSCTYVRRILVHYVTFIDLSHSRAKRSGVHYISVFMFRVTTNIHKDIMQSGSLCSVAYIPLVLLLAYVIEYFIQLNLSPSLSSDHAHMVSEKLLEKNLKTYTRSATVTSFYLSLCVISIVPK